MSDGRPSSSNSRTALFRAGAGLNIENEVTGPTEASRGLARPNSSMEMNVMPSVNLADKVKRLSNDMQSTFQRLMADMQQQESQSMIDFLEEARRSLRETGDNLHDEQEVLSLTSRKLSETRQTSARDPKDRSGATSARQRAQSRGATTLGNLDLNSQGRPQSARSRSRAAGPVSARSINFASTSLELEQQGIASNPKGRPRSTDLKSRTTPAPMDGSGKAGEAGYDSEKEYQDERDEIMNRMNGAESKNEKERERQSALLKERKEQKRIKQVETENTASAMVREATELDALKQKDKERQDQLVRDRLDERKKRVNDRTTPVFVDVHEPAAP